MSISRSPEGVLFRRSVLLEMKASDEGFQDRARLAALFVQKERVSKLAEPPIDFIQLLPALLRQRLRLRGHAGNVLHFPARRHSPQQRALLRRDELDATEHDALGFDLVPPRLSAARADSRATMLP